MKKYINTSNYYLSTTTSKIEEGTATGTFDVADVTVDWVTLPLQWYYWVDVDFGDASKREIFRIVSRTGYNLTYDMRISPNGRHTHQSGASVWLRDFSQLLNSLSTNTDNFWEIEQTGDLSIKVRWWVLYHPSNTNAETGKIVINDTNFTLSPSSTTYIVVEKDEVLWYQFAAKTELLLQETWQYPIAKITTGASMIDNTDGIIDLRATIIGQGNMRSELYDPDKKELDVYNYENFYNVPVATDWDISDISDREDKREYWNAKQEELIWTGPWQNIHTINWQNIMWPGNFSLDTILTVWWANFITEDWAETYTFQEWYYPLSEQSFIVFTDSGTMMVLDVDYTYDDETHIISFTEPLASSEHAYIWVMFDNWSWQTEIGSWIITLKHWTTTIDTFNVNQGEDKSIDIWDAVNDTVITFTQWWWASWDWETIWTITTNQSNTSTINIKWNIAVTQQQYDNLPSSKNTDGNRYFIYE